MSDKETAIALARQLQEKLALDCNSKILSPHSSGLELLMRVVIGILEGERPNSNYVFAKLETACGCLGYNLTPITLGEKIVTRLNLLRMIKSLIS